MTALDLTQLLRPRSVAIIGASDKNPWGAMALRVLKQMDFSGPVHLVNRRGGEVLGRQSVTSARAIQEPVDAAFVVVPASGLAEAIEDMADAGIRHGAIVTSGFAEVGDEGAAQQARIFARAEDLGLTLLGPNSLGFLNFVDRVGVGTLPVTTPLLADPRVGLVSQSGATAGILSRAANKTNVSLSYSVALGNEARVGLSDVVEFLVDDATTRSIAVFAESIRDPARFLGVARKALAARKPIVMLKVGIGELAAAVAQAHTGALVGDNKIFEAACREYGVVRVDTLEELLHTADFLAYAGVLPDAKFAVASISGGACEMIADRGDDHGVPFARFDAATTARVKAELPDFGAAHNPLDITGAAMSDPDLFRRSIAAIAPDPQVGLIGVCFEAPAAEEDVSPVTRPAIEAIAKGLNEAGVKGFLLQQTYQPITPFARQLAAEAGLPYIASGLGHTMRSVGAAFAWSRLAREGLPKAPPAPAPIVARPITERETLDVLAASGVPVVPARIARSRAEAEAAAREIAEPVVLKILSPDIQHKTEVGGVQLNLVGQETVGDAYEAMMARVAAVRPTAHIEGVIVSPMREGGLELFVGVARDPTWGLAIAVGLGGVFVELLHDTSLRLLPVRPEMVKTMLGELRGAKILAGYRGGPPVDVDAVARAVAAIGDAAIALGPDLASLEINPLWVDGDRIECLDALAVWTA